MNIENQHLYNLVEYVRTIAMRFSSPSPHEVFLGKWVELHVENTYNGYKLAKIIHIDQNCVTYITGEGVYELRPFTAIERIVLVSNPATPKEESDGE